MGSAGVKGAGIPRGDGNFTGSRHGAAHLERRFTTKPFKLMPN